MTRLTWAAAGERYYELGVDRGVLYVGSEPGVAWTGLIAVNETPDGGAPRPYYIDGVKYLNLSSSEEFGAVINAFSAPKEFGPCDGVTQIQNGLFATQQRRIPFGLTYRTMVGNDTEGQEHAYKIHIVYNCLAAPSSRSNNSTGESVDPVKFSWDITTIAPPMTSVKRTAHLIVDSRYADPDILADIEDLLYGSASNAPELPTAQEIIDIFTP